MIIFVGFFIFGRKTLDGAGNKRHNPRDLKETSEGAWLVRNLQGELRKLVLLHDN